MNDLFSIEELPISESMYAYITVLATVVYLPETPKSILKDIFL